MPFARFVAKTHPALSFDHDGWYTDPTMAPPNGVAPHTKSRHFQMVPLQDARSISVEVDGMDAVAWSEDTGICTIGGIADRFVTNPNNRVRVSPQAPNFAQLIRVIPGRAGRTRIILSDSNFNTIDSVEISVKAQIKKTYRVWRLWDARNRYSPRTKPEMTSIMAKVADLYDKQANTQLILVGRAEDLTVKRDLGNPIESANLLTFRCHGAITDTAFAQADFDIVSVWEMKDLLGKSNPLTKCGLISDYRPGAPLGEISTYAHELCHMFGQLTHVEQSAMLMSTSPPDGLQMTKNNINTINDSGWP